MDLQERLKTLKTNEFYKIVLEKTVSKQWYNDKEMCLYISKMILIILEKYYEPLGLWLQNPKTNNKINDKGVVIDGVWDLINYTNTNYSVWEIIFNTSYKFLVDYCEINNVTKVTINREDYDITNPHIFDLNWCVDRGKTKNEIRRILLLTYFFKDIIFDENKDIHKKILNIITFTSGRGREAENFFELKISDFFENHISFNKTEGTGDYDDRKQGVDFWIKSQDIDETVNVKSIPGIYEENDKSFIISVGISESSKCDYFAFVISNKEILLFRNDKNKIKRNVSENGIVFDSSLLIKRIKYV